MFTLTFEGETFNANSKDELLPTIVEMHKKAIFEWEVRKDGKRQVWCDAFGTVGFESSSTISPSEFTLAYLNL